MNDPSAAPRPPADVTAATARALLGGAIGTVTPGLISWEPPSPDDLASSFPGYRILRLLGRGGMGAVYEATQISLQRAVAIKLLPVEIGSTPEAVQRFRKEAHAMARLKHPNILSVYDFGETVDGAGYFVMELIEGTDLQTLIRSGGLTLTRALAIVRQVCDALEYAHGQGFVHRDIKPANILVDRADCVKVSDFGLAKALEPVGVSTSGPATRSGQILGTPEYSAPEQLSGTGTVDHRADIYSLGVMLYEMLTGSLPRGAFAPPSKLSAVGTGMDSVVLRALAPEPAERYQHASEVKHDVDRAAGPRLTAGRTAAAIIAAVLVAGAGYAGWRTLQPVENAGEAGIKPPAVNSGPLDLLAELDPVKESRGGDWILRLEGNRPALTMLKSGDSVPKFLRLPVHPGARGYDLEFSLTMADSDSDAAVIFTVGEARAGVLLNWKTQTGFGLIRGKKWNENETTTGRPWPSGREIRIRLRVRLLNDAQAEIALEADGTEWIKWSGNRADLTLYDIAPYSWVLPDRDALAFVSHSGNVTFRDVRIVWAVAAE